VGEVIDVLDENLNYGRGTAMAALQLLDSDGMSLLLSMICRMRAKARIMPMLICMARSLSNTAESIATPAR
jgi:ABC-type transporter Mla MlaB component